MRCPCDIVLDKATISHFNLADAIPRHEPMRVRPARIPGAVTVGRSHGHARRLLERNLHHLEWRRVSHRLGALLRGRTRQSVAARRIAVRGAMGPTPVTGASKETWIASTLGRA